MPYARLRRWVVSCRHNHKCRERAAAAFVENCAQRVPQNMCTNRPRSDGLSTLSLPACAVSCGLRSCHVPCACQRVHKMCHQQALRAQLSIVQVHEPDYTRTLVRCARVHTRHASVGCAHVIRSCCTVATTG